MAGLDPRGRTVLLTGATGGIGEAIARALHARGATVVLSGRDERRLEELRARLGERARVAVADLARRADVEALAERAAEEVDVLVANAALPASGTLESFSPEQIDRALDVNLRAPIVLTRALLPRMLARGAGHLLYVSSMSGKIATARSGVYSATKFGLRGFAAGVREDVRGTGVGVTVVFPGIIGDAGMFAETGVVAPRAAGARTAADVARAVVAGIEHGRAEIDVASALVRLGGRVNALAPGLVSAISRRMGAEAIAEELAERQRSKR